MTSARSGLHGTTIISFHFDVTAGVYFHFFIVILIARVVYTKAKQVGAKMKQSR